MNRRTSLEQNLRDMERAREAYWLGSPNTASLKLRWRALTVRHCFHVLPGESILELGAGSGLWTEHLVSVLRGENPITAGVFNDVFAEQAAQRTLVNTEFVRISDLSAEFPEESFDYVVGTAILCHDQYPQNLQALYRLLKPGGQLLFFEANYWNPQVFVKNAVPPIGRWAGQAKCQVGMRKYELMRIASQQGFAFIDVIPYDILHSMTPKSMIPFVQSLAYILQHAPGVRHACGTLYIWAKKPGDEEARRPSANFAKHAALFDSTSVVVPAHNEEMNVPRLVNKLLDMYDSYIHEVIIVNDNSTDRTSQVTQEIAEREPRVKLVNRKPPNGVGRALRDGYSVASGRYILSTDCDFVPIVPELRDLFEVVATGADGAIGSRFSHESVLLNYPFFKIICNRAFHLLVNLLLPGRVRDVSNNLKLYRTEILQNLDIEDDHFAANAETGLKPLLAGYDIREVPMSWINRTIDMGSSTFNTLKVAPNYFSTLIAMVWNTWRGRRSFVAKPDTGRQLPVESSVEYEGETV